MGVSPDTAIPDTGIEVSCFDWVPDFARGQVRDLRVRWALEEAGLPYRTRKLDARTPRPDDYLAWQPFGQVPAYRDDEVSLFESGAIVHHIGQGSEALLPADPASRARAVSWMFAALNSIEPSCMELATIDIFAKGQEWTAERRPQVVETIAGRLAHLSDHLGARNYLEGRFTAGDLLMSTVLRILDGKNLVEAHPNLARYKARCEARPAFGRALAAQLGDFEQSEAA